MKYLSLIEDAFEQIGEEIFNNNPQSLYEPIRYAMAGGGKKIRPLLMLFACEMYGGKVEDCIKAAFGVELFHNFTLLHDDIMDNADTRRGRDAVHKKYGLTSGILSGDVMMFYAQQQFYSYEQEQAILMSKLFNQTAIEICEGQQMDMDFEEQSSVAEADYIEMIRLKTAVLLACSLQMGAIVAGASKQDQQLMYQFGIEIGIAFQLQDDYLDSFGEKAKVGKIIGGDIIENKKTILWIKALQSATQKQKDTIEKWSEITSFDETKITEIKQIFKTTDSKKYCRQLMEEYHAKSLETLSKIAIEKSKKSNLENLANLIVNRVS